MCSHASVADALRGCHTPQVQLREVTTSLLLASALAGCQVDDRVLSTRPADDDVIVLTPRGDLTEDGVAAEDASGTVEGKQGRLDAGGSKLPGAAFSEAGARFSADAETEETPAELERCPDLDDNGLLDCEETLLANPGFDLSASAWVVDGDASAQWVDEDSRGSEVSGSLEIVNLSTIEGNSNVFAGVSQCVEVDASKEYILHVKARLRGPTDEGAAGANVRLYAEADCEGAPTGLGSAYTSIAEWRVPRTSVEPPEGTRSARVSLGVLKPPGAQSSAALIDDALFKVRSE